MPETMNSFAPAFTTGTSKMIVFSIKGQDYCLDIMLMREIRSWTTVTPLPNAPAYILGVINLRGSVIPIVDMSLRLYGRPYSTDKQRVVAIVECQNKISGLLVDDVTDIIDITPGSIQELPEFATHLSLRAVSGLATHQDRMMGVLRLDEVFNVEIDLSE